MEEFVAYIIKNLVSKPEEVTVSTSSDEDKARIEIRVAGEDVGKVIGRRGNTINALRTIVRTVATRLGQRVQVELIQTDQPEGDEEVVAVEECSAEEACCEEQECCQQEECTQEEAMADAEPAFA